MPLPPFLLPRATGPARPIHPLVPGVGGCTVHRPSSPAGSPTPSCAPPRRPRYRPRPSQAHGLSTVSGSGWTMTVGRSTAGIGARAAPAPELPSSGSGASSAGKGPSPRRRRPPTALHPALSPTSRSSPPGARRSSPGRAPRRAKAAARSSSLFHALPKPHPRMLRPSPVDGDAGCSRGCPDRVPSFPGCHGCSGGWPSAHLHCG
jgi:hypothetical protein